MYKEIEFSYPFFDLKGEAYFIRDCDLWQLMIHSIVSDSCVEETKERLIVLRVETAKDETGIAYIDSATGQLAVKATPFHYRGDPFVMADKIILAKEARKAEA